VTIRLLPVLLAMLSFSGCTLIDQRTFAPAPEAKAQPAPAMSAVPIDTRTALVTIDYAGPPPQYGELLHYAVHAAEERDQQVQFDVVSIVKSTADAAAGQQQAIGVMRAIMRDRVPPTRIHLALRTDPTLAASQVRVYVR
jgi:hypothetical protein